MTNSLKPRDEKEVGEALQWALAEGKTFEVMGHGSKRGIGRAAQTDITLDLSGMTGIELYEPDELILSARAGTPIAEIEKALAAHNQELAFEPMDCGPLLGGTPGRGTLGGLVSANLSGPRRIKAGAVRDFALGTRAYSGRGEFFKAGGRVVKNVTGYDLPKFLAGSWGTLAVLTEITIKVLPRADDVETVLVFGLDDIRAVEAMSAAMGSSCEVSGAAHLPAYAASRMTIQSIAGSGKPVTALRLEGIPVSIAYRRKKLEEFCAASAKSRRWAPATRACCGGRSVTSSRLPTARSTPSGASPPRPRKRRGLLPRSGMPLAPKSITTGPAA
jgi:glycolate oxidase FAD binding subunit